MLRWRTVITCVGTRIWVRSLTDFCYSTSNSRPNCVVDTEQIRCLQGKYRSEGPAQGLCPWSVYHVERQIEGRSEVKVAHSCLTLCHPMDCSLSAPLPTEFLRPEYWSGQPFPSSGDLPNPGVEPGLPHCRWILNHLSHKGEECLNKMTELLHLGRPQPLE